MNTVVDVYISFPADAESERAFDKLRDYFTSVEELEESFEIELSCGDGKYLSDFWEWSENGEGLSATAADEELEKYDGKICLQTPPRLNAIKMSMRPAQMTPDKYYHFTVKYFEKAEEAVFYLNSRERSRRWVG